METITIIIITILASIIGTLVLAYFIWLGIGVYKLNKKVADNTQLITGIISDMNYIREDIQTRDTNTNLHFQGQIEDVFKSIQNDREESEKTLDRRFNKVYNKIAEVMKNNGLKDADLISTIKEE